MVKKLFKHELNWYMRVMLPVWGILLAVAALARLIQLFEQDTVVYDIISGSSVFFYVIAVVACLVFPLVLGIMRFYRNLFTGEGYLSFTLPATPFQHVWGKVTAAALVQTLSFVAAALSVSVISAGELFVEILKAIAYLMKQAYKLAGHDLVFYIIEVIVAAAVILFYEFLFYYTCISVGQLFKKNRVLVAVGIYFGWYALGQIAGTVFVIVAASADWEPLMRFVAEHFRAALHIALCGGTLLAAVLSVAFFAITHTIISKRLNLE